MVWSILKKVYNLDFYLGIKGLYRNTNKGVNNDRNNEIYTKKNNFG